MMEMDDEDNPVVGDCLLSDFQLHHKEPTRLAVAQARHGSE